MTTSVAVTATAGEWLLRWTSLVTLCLLVATWPLWSLTSDFPAVPAFEFLCSTPGWVDRLLLYGLVGGLVIHCVASVKLHLAARVLILTCGLGLLALDQHRWQPWIYQLLIFMIIAGMRDFRLKLSLLQWLLISVYFYSAIGKFDYEFLHTVGQDFLGVLYSWFGMEGPRAGKPHVMMAALLPLGELAIAGLLAVRTTRRLGGFVASLFHLGLIMVLGPFGLQHSTGVLLWNLQFAGQAILLFSWPQAGQVSDAEPTPETAHRGWPSGCITAFVGIVMLLPAVERVGLWDHWPSWALYAPHASRTEVWVAATRLDRLPDSLQSTIVTQNREQIWVPIPIEAWSLQETRAPIYPQARFQLGVATALAENVQSEFAIGARIEGPAGRWDGEREIVEVEGLRQIKAAGQEFWLNIIPRSGWGRRVR